MTVKLRGIEEKSVRIIEFSGKQFDWDGWSEKFFAKAKRRGYKGLLLGRDKVRMQEIWLSPVAVPVTTRSSHKGN